MSDQPGGLRRNLVRRGETPTEEFAWGRITWLDNAAITGSQTLTVGHVEIEPGQANPTHAHPNCEEVLYLLEGELDHLLGDEVLPMRAGDLIHVPVGVPHQGRNTGTVTARMVVSYNTGRRETTGFDPSER